MPLAQTVDISSTAALAGSGFLTISWQLGVATA